MSENQLILLGKCISNIAIACQRALLSSQITLKYIIQSDDNLAKECGDQIKELIDTIDKDIESIAESFNEYNLFLKQSQEQHNLLMKMFGEKLTDEERKILTELMTNH